MKIAQITHNYLPHIGGVEYYVRRLVESLKEKGASPVVLTTDLDTGATGRKPEALYFRTSVVLMRNPFSFGFIQHLRKHQYDILHIHSAWFLHGLMAVIFKKKARIITTIHGVFPEKSSILLKAFLGLYQYFIRYILRQSDYILVYSEIEKTKLLKLYTPPPGKINVIPMAIPVEKEADWVKEPIILFTGRIIPDKNPEILLKAVRLLDQKFHYVKLVFVGSIDDAYKKQLLSLSVQLDIQNEIVFVGPLDPSVPEEKKQLLDHYQKARVFVSLGSWEGQPTRLMEAMQYKTPVIAYAAGGTADFVKDEENGMIIRKLDEVMLAEKLTRILTDEQLAEHLGANARKTIENGYSWDKAFEKIFRLYKDLPAHNTDM